MSTQFMKLGFEERVLREDGFYNMLLDGKLQGFNLDLRINYYRGLPLSSVQKLELTVDGKKIPQGLIVVEVNGKMFTVEELPDLYAEYWGIKTPAHLHVYNGGLAEGEHEVSVHLELKSCYMAFAPGVYGMIDGSASKRMTLGEGREFA